MIWFAILIALFTVGALLCVLPPLLRRRPKTDGVARPASNLSILRDQLAELDSDLRNGVITPEQHAKSRSEIEGRVLEETRIETGMPTAASSATRWSAVALGVLIPVVSMTLYLMLGNPAGLLPQRALSAEHQLTSKQIEKLVAQLADRLAKNPEDAQGWAILARSYVVLHRYPEAVAAFEKATRLVPNDAGLYADYADAVAMTQGKRIEGKALELVNRALAIDPTQFKALALAGSAAYAKGDYKGALAYWEKLQQLIPANSELGKSLASSIAEARNLGGIKDTGKPAAAKTASAAPAAAAISGKVTLSPAISSKANPQDTLFVLARAVKGPRMPLAVIRRKVKDLPLEFTLDDSLAMSPAAKLSSFPEVTLIAHISKSGGVLAQSGDLEGSVNPVKVGSKDVALVIDKVVP